MHTCTQTNDKNHTSGSTWRSVYVEKLQISSVAHSQSTINSQCKEAREWKCIQISRQTDSFQCWIVVITKSLDNEMELSVPETVANRMGTLVVHCSEGSQTLQKSENDTTWLLRSSCPMSQNIHHSSPRTSPSTMFTNQQDFFTYFQKGQISRKSLSPRIVLLLKVWSTNKNF